MSKVNYIHLILCLTVFIVGFIPRLMWALADHPQPFSDMEDYYLCAVNFIREGYLGQSSDRLAYRAPLYPMIITVIIKFFASPLLVLRIFQAFLGASSALLIYSLALHVNQPRKPINAVFVFLLPAFSALTYTILIYPIFFVGIVMSEVIFIFLLLIWLNLIMYTSQHKSYAGLLISSLFVGLLALIRPISLIFLPIIIYQAWKIISVDNRLKYMWLPAFGWLLPILPWTIRNCFVFVTFVFITTNSGVNFFIGHSPAFGYYEQGLKEPLRQHYSQTYGYSEVGEDRYLFQMGLQSIMENPSALLTRSYYKLYFLYWLEAPPWPLEEYPHQALYSVPGVKLFWSHWFVVLALLGAIVAYIKKMPHQFLLSVILLYTLAVLIFFARTRFRMPIEPILILYMWIFVLSLVEWGYSRYLYWRRHN